MASLFLAIPILVSFLVCLFFLPSWIRRAHKGGLVGKDINKYSKPKVAEGGGMPVVAGFVLGTLIYVALKTFYFGDPTNIVEIFALLSVILMISFVGMIDDFMGWKIGLSKKLRMFLVLLAAIPLMVVNAGDSLVSIPFIGSVNLGLIYTLILIPIGVAGASTTFNFLAGHNGLEARQGVLMLLALSIITWLTGNSWLSIIGLCMVASLIAFLFFNNYPAKVLPGDVTTYAIGALLASIAVLGNIERFAVSIFALNIVEVFLKARSGLKAESFGVPQKDGSLQRRQNKIYSMTDVAMILLKKFKGKAYERDVVIIINIMQLIVIFIAFMIFGKGLIW